MKEIVIREYQAKDWKRLREIHDKARAIELHLAELNDAFIPLAEAAFREGLFEYTICVATINDKIYGFAAYSEDELAWLYVDPAHSRRGIGKSLIEYVITQITRRPINVEVLAGNEPALNLYKSMGFETVEVCSGVMPGNESFHVTVHCMQKF
ncbi:GNAT family N-acetyltransferase [Clostridium sp. Marseille-P299]|uniref:GNAT family N-acetyltransferase n=1 Tax=Clostridium sp. Marseille-P299 TaxID=1805477 RepID=UPI00082C1921|nr:GNAT family N-acetyltransferase [Clostridium sp. Marseille-P299]